MIQAEDEIIEMLLKIWKQKPTHKESECEIFIDLECVYLWAPDGATGMTTIVILRTWVWLLSWDRMFPISTSSGHQGQICVIGGK